MERTKKKNQNIAVEPEEEDATVHESETEKEDAADQKEPETEKEDAADQKEPETEKEDATVPESETEKEDAADQKGTEAEEEDKKAGVLDRLPNPCVYCGPSIRGVTRQYTIYQGGGLPDPLKEIIKEHPKIQELIVSDGEFQAMRRRLDTPGTPEANLYKAIREALTRGRSV